MALSNLYFLKDYNNYFNRQLKKYETLQEYLDKETFNAFSNINFNPNDGVNTQITMNWSANWLPDYLLVDNISRWFVLESKRTRSGQYTFTLRRDVLADNWLQVLNAPMYIEKATVNDNSSFIYNPEPFECNQVKILEAEIYDETETAWIVGYLDRGYNSDGQAGAINFSAEVIPDFTATDLNAFLTNQNILQDTYYLSEQREVSFLVKYAQPIGNGQAYTYTIKIGKDDITLDSSVNIYTDTFAVGTLGNSLSEIITKLKAIPELYSTLSSYYKLYVDDISKYNQDKYNQVAKLQNQVLVTADKPSEYYTFDTSIIVNDRSTYTISEDRATGYLLTYLTTVFSGIPNVQVLNSQSPQIRILADSVKFAAVLSQQGTYSLLVQKDRYTLKDGPYDMFIMPYGDVTLKNGNEFSVQYNKKTAMSIAQGIAKNLGSFIYDIQILPFCPATGFIIDGSTIDINSTNSKRYSKIMSRDTIRGAIIWCTASSGSKYIPYVFNGITNKKLFNCTTKFRLSAGNYAAGFDFSPVKNEGVLGMHVDYTYIPYSPYIRVAPNFGGLYGKDFKDCRGLIIQGDHSITYLSDKWVEYQINNKNYLNAFNRQMENMDVQRTYQRAEQILSSTVGALSAGVQVGSVLNAGAGIAAGAASAIGGIADTIISEQLYNENKSYAKDQFQYSLGNVQALPNTLAKVVAYTPNNKIVPVLEVYYGTAEDNLAFCNMIRYQGMTVGAIGYLQDYIDNSWEYAGIKDKGFVKGRILQISDLSDDYHLASTIADEIALGVYTK